MKGQKMNGTDVSKIAVPEVMLSKWQTIVNMIAQLLSISAALITRIQDDQLEILQTSETEGNPFKAGMRVCMDESCCREAFKHPEGFRIPNLLKDQMWNNVPAVKAGLMAYMGFPLFWPHGEPFGTVCAFDVKENQFAGFFVQIVGEFKELVENHLALLFTNHELMQKTRELQESLDEIQKLRGIIPICAQCKRVRNDEGYWQAVDVYLRTHGDIKFSQGYCPDCMSIL